MKILLITAHFPPSLGGVENYVFNIALGLKLTYNHEVVVITSSLKDDKQGIENYSGIKVFRLPVMVRVSNTPINPLWYFAIKKIIRDEQPDIINAHMPVMFMGDMAAFVSGSTPFILTYHSGTMKKNKFPIDILIYLYEQFILPRTANKATRIICASHFVRNTLLKNFASKITVISPGVNTSLYHPNPDVKREEKRILFVARHRNMYAMKGLYYLIDAVEMLPGVKLRIVGEKDVSNKNNIEFAGLKQGNDLAAEMQRASVVVLPSLVDRESFGMVLIEAMACQTPVIGTNAGGIPEVITDGVDGFIVPVKDSNALALAISKIMADKELAARLGQHGWCKVTEKFTWETRVALTKEVFVSCQC